MASCSNSTEEKYPLLLLLVEDGSGKSNSGGRGKRIFFEKNRFNGIASGATAVITQWPSHLTTCWLTSLLCFLTIILLGMMVLAASIHPNQHSLNARCIYTNRNSAKIDNKTIHLVHGPEIWSQKQIRILEEVVQNYQQNKVHIVLMQNKKNLTTPAVGDIINEQSIKGSKRTNRKSKRRRRRSNNSQMNKVELDINIGTKKILNMLLKQKHMDRSVYNHKDLSKTQTIEQFLQKHPNIVVTRLTFGEAFNKSPLQYSWHHLNSKTRLFAIRVLYLWQYGGISFDLSQNSKINSAIKNYSLYKYETATETYEMETTETPRDYEKIFKFITMSLDNFSSIPDGMVTVDQDGMHMETKTSCHAFFGELLINLRKAEENARPADVIQATLKTFCKKGAVDSDYCNSINE